MLGYRGTKQYGNYTTDTCPLCGARAYTKNDAGVAVCKAHKNAPMPNWKCPCGSWVDLRSGKYGNYAYCSSCGPQNMRKIMEFNAGVHHSKEKDATPRPAMGATPSSPKPAPSPSSPSRTPSSVSKDEYDYGILLD